MKLLVPWDCNAENNRPITTATTESLTSGDENIQLYRQEYDTTDHAYPVSRTEVSTQSQAAEVVEPSTPPHNIRLTEHALLHEHIYGPRHNRIRARTSACATT